jgi:hypothetical protein
MDGLGSGEEAACAGGASWDESGVGASGNERGCEAIETPPRFCDAGEVSEEGTTDRGGTAATAWALPATAITLAATACPISCDCWLIAAVRASCTMELICSSWEVENEAGVPFTTRSVKNEENERAVIRQLPIRVDAVESDVTDHV